MHKRLVQSINPKLWLSLAAGLVLAAAVAGVGLSHAESNPTPTPESPAAGVFLNLDSVQGESADSQHTDQIDLSSFDWAGVTNPGSAGSGAGKVQVHDIQVSKRVDKSSPILMQACATGTHYKQATISVRKAGGTQDYLVYTLSDVLVSSYQVADKGDQPTEQISLNFGKVSVEYSPQKPDGSLGSAIEGVINQQFSRTFAQ